MSKVEAPSWIPASVRAKARSLAVAARPPHRRLALYEAQKIAFAQGFPDVLHDLEDQLAVALAARHLILGSGAWTRAEAFRAEIEEIYR